MAAAVEIVDGHGVCFACQERKPASEFHKSIKGRVGEIRSRCRQCRNRLEKVALARRLEAMTPEEREAVRLRGCEQSRRSRAKRCDEMGEEAFRDRRRASRQREDPEQKRRRAKRNWLSRMYGMTLEDYEELFKAQNGSCAICDANDRKLCVDHDHDTGEVRQILCEQCNYALGLLGERADVAEAMAIYIRKWKPA